MTGKQPAAQKAPPGTKPAGAHGVGAHGVGAHGVGALGAASFDSDVRPPENGSGAPPRRSMIERMSRALAGAPTAERATFDLGAPLRALYAAAPQAPAEAARFSLGFLLTQSALKIDEAKKGLLQHGAQLAGAIEDRRGGEQQFAVSGLRLLIALVWAAYAFWLDRAALTAIGVGAQLVDGAMPIGDAQTIARMLLWLAIAGFAGAMLSGAVTNISGRGSNTRLRAVASGLGKEAAAIAKDFDAALDELRGQMDKRGARPDAVEDLSRMHMTALEASAFFHDVQFLTDADRGSADRRFRSYLARAAGEAAGAPPARSAESLVLLIAGIVIGVGIGYYVFSPTTAASATATASLSKYPLPYAAVALLGILYASIGLLLSMFRGPITIEAAVRARDEALDSVRAAFVAGHAPRVDTIIRRIEDALDVYKARLASGQHAAGASHAAQSDEPAWRRGPEGPRFVAQSFLAAPDAFRADPPAAPQRRFFSSRKDDGAAPKQSLDSGETGRTPPPWLNE